MVLCRKSVEFHLSIENDSSVRYKVAARILENMTVDLILGIYFIHTNEVSMNLVENKLRIISGNYFEINKEEVSDNITKKIKSKTRICTLSSIPCPEERIDTLMRKQKLSNSEIGLILIKEHTIELRYHEPICRIMSQISPIIKEKTLVELIIFDKKKK